MLSTAFIQPIVAIKSVEIKEEKEDYEESIRLDVIIKKIGKRRFKIEAYAENTGDAEKKFKYGNLFADFYIRPVSDFYAGWEDFSFYLDITELKAHERVFLGSEVWNGWLIYEEFGIFMFKFRLRKPFSEGEYKLSGSLCEVSFDDEKCYDGVSEIIYLPPIF
jgi:hypothetical protein